MSAPFNLKNELMRWGPVTGYYFYTSDFVEAIFGRFPKAFPGHVWSHTLFLFRDKRMVWLNDLQELEKDGRALFSDQILPADKRQQLYINWHKTVKRLGAFEQTLPTTDLGVKSEAELFELWKTFFELMQDFWIPTIPAELGNYGSPALLQEQLRPYVPADEMANALEVLTAPEALSFYQEEEIALSKTDNIAEHTKDWFWLKNSYAGTAILSEKFFADRKKQLEPGLENKLKEYLSAVRKKKEQLIERYNLSHSVQAIAEGVSQAVAWQDERKKYIFILQHYKELLAREFAKRAGIVWEDVLNSGIDELPRFKDKEFRDVLLARRAGFGWNLRAGSIAYATNEQSNSWWDQYAEAKVTQTTNELKGTIASKGAKPLVQGKVRIVLNPEGMSFDSGSILVAPMTSPEYVFLMKQSVAIVTDTGGLTSHAAIVSRELNKVCLVGTKLATKIFKDGDLVEVDVEKGIVRKVA